MYYQNALDYILSFADYERWPGAGYAERWDLRRMGELLERLGSPHLARKTVHIAGSKGKGSTAAMIASALSTAGFRTGLYTSPHLHTMRERIKVDDHLITEQEFADLVAELEPEVEEQNRGKYGALSTFEILTALAFLHFHKKGADFQVLETGLGGRLDATNVTIPEVCILTSISLDHTAVLGDTISQIAAEKAGIIKSGVPVVSSPQVPEAAEVIGNVCSEKNSRLIMVGEDISWEGRESTLDKQSFEVNGLKGHYHLAIPLLGEHQLENAVTAVGALEVLDIDQAHILTGLADVNWSGRLEILRQEPLLIADGAHNGDSARRLVESLKKLFQFNQSILIIGTSADKNSMAMVAEFAPFFNWVIATSSQHPRATDPKVLAAEFAEYGVGVQITANVGQAVAEALAQAGEADIICATGSLFLIAEVIEEIKGTPGERYPSMEPK
ncbi:MAG: bifunctional folylpolyglutamate synthase/dihydrofolate synthase [Chloroflexi bacterium]|jgi:dihydrofolate synthase / folylpolyglutamate synthase|nr:bifunctional folylpolyglutamate synthase/dihydrofolate synthase [Chloroflexota bacterium]